MSGVRIPPGPPSNGVFMDIINKLKWPTISNFFLALSELLLSFISPAPFNYIFIFLFFTTLIGLFFTFGKTYLDISNTIELYGKKNIFKKKNIQLSAGIMMLFVTIMLYTKTTYPSPIFYIIFFSLSICCACAQNDKTQ